MKNTIPSVSYSVIPSPKNKVSQSKFVYIYFMNRYRKSIHICWDSLHRGNGIFCSIYQKETEYNKLNSYFGSLETVGAKHPAFLVLNI